MQPREHYSTSEIEPAATTLGPAQRHEAPPAATAVGRRRASQRRASGERLLVLAALDDERFRGAVERMLRLQGFAVRGAATASDAIDVIRAERPAGAIVDLGELGQDVAVAMPLPQPVLLLSRAARSSGLVARIRPRTRLMAKPCSIVLLIEALQEMLASAERVTAMPAGSAGAARRIAEFPPPFLRP